MHKNKQITIYDIAKVLNISASTVSRGLKDHPLIKEETKRRIKSTAEKMGYQENPFASNLRSKRSNTIGVVVPRLDSYFMSKVISGIEITVNKHGYNLIINQSEESQDKEAKCIQTMYNSRVDGILLSVAADTNDLDHLEIIYNKNIPLVFFDRIEQGQESTSILIDNILAATEIVSHLADQGCKKILHVGGNLNRNVYKDRYEGYKKALKEYKLTYEEVLIYAGNLSEEMGISAASEIIKMKNRPDAVFAANDTTAVSLMIELQKLGIQIPGDIAVAGFNNDPISRIVKPNLTTVNYPGKEMGEIAASTLIEEILGERKEENNRNILLKHDIILRESSQK